MVDTSRAYNSVWQLRADAWCRLEDAADQLTRAAAVGKPIDGPHAICEELLTRLTPFEPLWAYPGAPRFAKLDRLFATARYDKFAHAVAQINRALSTEVYRRGIVDIADLDNQDALAPDQHQSDAQPAAHTHERPYFEVLAVESLTDEQKRTVRSAVQRWRRPDDEFTYELVLVSSVAEALVAARLNVNLQAVVIGRRFAAQSARDLSALADFVDTGVSDRLTDGESPGEWAEVLAAALTDLRPELDLYLMTELEVEKTAGRTDTNFRRVFHAREGFLELHLSILYGVAARYQSPFFSALKQYSHRPTGVFHALPISQGKSIVNSHWIQDMVGFYGLDVFMAETSATCGGLDSLLEPTGPLREAQDLAAKT
ncbi:MAG: ornithine decarboxylase, partial [Actinomycetia bacterium]|nr:ornithine decarboxylase [Actinomycetes bacterium]